MPAFSKNTIAGARGRGAAHPRKPLVSKPLVSETRGLRWWDATLPCAPAMVFFGNAGIGVFVVLALVFSSSIGVFVVLALVFSS